MTAAIYSVEYFIHELRSTSPDEVRKVYVKLSKEVHPDLHPELGVEPMQMLNDAYELVQKGWHGKTYHSQGKDGTTRETEFHFNQEVEAIFQEIIRCVTVLDCTQEVELVGAWIWVKADRANPFTCPKDLMDGADDPRPTWSAIDGTPLRFQWSGGQNQRWYFDLRRIVTRQYDRKKRSRKGIGAARRAYGSTRFDKRDADTGLPRYAY